jgi:glucans biosynthesis protein
MFWYGENTGRPAGQARPEVHDSDGLAIEMADGSVMWRPLDAVDRLRTTSYPVVAGAMKRFGLFQRDRDFGSYEDTEARYDIRPSAWVEPVSGFEAGAVRLVELAPTKEYGDNIGAHWVPEEPMKAGEERTLVYRLVWAMGGREPARLARVVATWQARPEHGGADATLWVDFAGEVLQGLDGEEPTLDLRVGEGVGVRHQTLMRLPDNRGWRVALQLGATGNEGDMDLSARLLRGFEPISERWSFTWRP